MISSPYVYSAIVAQHQSDIRDGVGAHRLTRQLRADRRAARRDAGNAIRAARLEARIAERPVATGTPTVAH